MHRLLLTMLFLFSITLPAYASSDVEEVTSPYGFKAWVIEDHSLPLVSIHMAFRKSGTAYDPKDKQGLAYMVRSLLDEGAGDMDSTAFKQALERHAIHLSFDVDEDNFYINLKTLKENLPQALTLFKNAILSPRFDKDAVERIRNQIYTAIEARKEDPATQANEAFRKLVFGNHPYARTSIGTKTSVAAITLDDLKQFTKRHFTRLSIVISAVGNIRPQEVATLLDQYFIDLPLATANVSKIAEFTAFPSGTEQSIAMNIPQSTAIFGLRGVKRDDPDFYAVFLLNHILGGGTFSSRLMQEVREKNGLAYGVSTSLKTMDHAGLIQGYVATENAKIPQSLTIIRNVITNTAEHGVTQEELDNAKNYLMGSFPLNLDKNEKLASYLIGMQLENLGKDFLQKRNSYIQNITLDDVNRAAKQFMTPDRLVVSIVGGGEKTQAEGKNNAALPSGH